MGVESFVEREAVAYLESRGGAMLKFVSPGNKGVPDRICAHPDCAPFLIEFKSPTKKPDPTQQAMCEWMAARGFRIYRRVATIRVAKEIIDDEIAGRRRRHVSLIA
jgi:hypothetical protein